MEARVAVAKVPKYATSESGDTFEMVERPNGGLSFVLADGQRSGKPAKNISLVVARKAISLLAEGVRDGAAARAASDYLFTYRGGKVMATLNILSLDLATRTLVITRNNPAPVLLIRGDELHLLDAPASPVGTRRDIRPHITEVPLEPGLVTLVFSDGLQHAGERRGRPFDIPAAVRDLRRAGPPDPAHWANTLLEQAVALDDGRPADDISVLVAAVLPRRGDGVRRLQVRLPIP